MIRTGVWRKRTMEEMKKISIEDLEKISGGGDYDFIHYTDGKSCRHYPARVLESQINETRTVVKFICRRCGEVAYYWQYHNEGDLYFVTEEEYNVIKANRR